MSEPIHEPQVDDETARRMNRGYVAVVVAAVMFVALTCVAFLVPVPYVTMRPGPAFDTLGEIDGEPMFTFGEGVETFETDGALDFTTVSVTRSSGRLTLAEALQAWNTDDVVLVPRDVVYPEGATDEDSKAQGAAQLTSSKDTSRAAALRAAGYEVPETPKVVDVVEDGASVGLLESEDLVLGIDGEPVEKSTDVVARLGETEPGDDVRVEIDRDGKRSTVDVTTKAAPDDPDRAMLGITVGTHYDFPIEIENHVGDQVGGPSAGTMFALAIYDRLTPGSLTGGERIAGSGEIAGDGTVGGIGGIRQKMAGAAADGASVFLVPADNCAEAAQGDDHGMRLVEVANLDGAIDALESLAEDPDAEVPQCQ